MPLYENPGYRPPIPFRNGHLETIAASLLRPIPSLEYIRQRIETPDGDFLDLDWSPIGSDAVALLCHGLEGHSDRAYMRGMARALNRVGLDAAALNFRGCSGLANRRFRTYHSGATDDLATVVQQILAAGHYRQLALVGFSLGGNVVLRYLGEQGERLPAQICSAAAVSVPVDLPAAGKNLQRPSNKLYEHFFLRSLTRKMRQKSERFPRKVDLPSFFAARTLEDFDDLYTAPAHGYRDVDDYWQQAASGPLLGNIRVPTLLINALNDPLLTPGCFPRELARRSETFHLSLPRFGGHIGFIRLTRSADYWHESKAARFIRESVVF